ncbi:HEPN domain-containing protein [Methylomicrobium lacus]|uniref:HEPN domain-containing protein n=1 Tax=Methylomicrobium lacus TaxID=136992 RepID=UPI00045EA317|nr:HEPN domain-containing protein [Methylomicrobium lacus]
MYSTLPEYISDMNKVSSLLKLTDSLKNFIGENSDEIDVLENEFFKSVFELQNLSRENHANLVVLNGTLLLFMVGRFESFVRSTFEELCINTAEKAERFTYLPKEMRESLVTYTAEVISNPRKYGHADLGVRNFVRVLSDNLSDNKELTEINSNCISITSENMRPTVLSDLFKRVGIKNIWEKISQQAKIQIFFETHDASKAKKDIERYLGELMDKRNSIAHPSSSFTWPDHDYVQRTAEFLKVLGTVLVDSLEVIEFDLGQRIEEARANKATQ